MTASIRINGSSGPLQVTPGTPCVLSNFSNVGVLGWQWVLADKPVGSTAVLTGATTATASFTPDLPGTYLVRLTTYSDAGRTVADAASSAAAYIRFTSAPYWRLPAAGETSEVDASRGWAAELLSILKDVQAGGGGGGGGGGAAPEVIQYVDGAPDTVAVGSTTTLVVVRTIDPTDITFTLPAPSAGRRVTFKQAGVSAGRALYVAPHGAETVEQIDGPSTFLRGSQLAYGLAWTFQYDATDAIWRLVWSTESGLAFDAFTTLAGQAYVAIPPTDGQIPVFDGAFVEWKFQDNIPKDGSVSLAKLADLSVSSVVSAAASIAATIDHVTVDTQAAGGNVALTVDDRKQHLLITKVSTTLQSISITPPVTVQLHGHTAGTSVILPYSIRVDRPSWVIWRETATKWWILPALSNGSRWATVATYNDLPNVAGSSTQSTELAYGDTCVTTAAGPYICSVATPGAAVWVPMAVLAGQLGQTSNLPDVRGLRETGGPTLLSMGAVADGGVLVRSGTTITSKAIGTSAGTVAAGDDARFASMVTTSAPIYSTSIFFSPSNPSPAQGVITTWSGLQAALTAVGQWTPKRVYVDGQYVGYAITVPSGISHTWDMTEFIGDVSNFNFAQGCTIASFWGVSFKDLILTSLATSGACPFTNYLSGYSGIPVTLKSGTTCIYGGGTGKLPLFDITAGADGVTFEMEHGTYMLENVVACVRVSGGAAYFSCAGNASIGSGAVSSSNAASTASIRANAEYGSRIGSAAFTDTVHSAWTLGTITFTRHATASMVKFTPTGNVAATDVQSAIAEVDSEKAAVAGQIGGTAASPDVRGIRETAGPTLLTIGSIADGQVLVRAGSTIIGATPSAGPQGTMVKPNLRLAGISPVTVTGTFLDIAWNGSIFCAIGASNAVATSPDGITWTGRTTGATNSYTGICWAPSLGLFVAVGTDSSGFITLIYTSPDGITWTQRYTSGTPLLNSCCSNAAGTVVVACGTSGLLLSSTNGTSWTSRTSGFGTDNISQVAWNGTLFVAVGGAGKIATSPDGITWTLRTSGTSNVLIGVAANPATGRCVAIGAAGTVRTSADGITWTAPNYLQNVGSGNLIQIGFGDEVFIVGPFGSGTTCWASPDGVNWSLRSCNTGANFGTGQPTRGAVYGAGRYVWPAANVIVASDVAT